MLLNDLMPIIILLLIIGFLVLVVLKMTPKTRQRHSYSKLVQRLFGVYMVVLILTVPTAFMLPEASDLPAEVEKVPEELPLLWELAADGDIETAGHVYRQGMWELTTEREALRLEMVSGHDPHAEMPVFVERVSDRDNTIEAAYYQTPFIVEGRDMSDELNPMDVKLSSGIIRIDAPVPAVIELSMFKQEFPISQFTGKEGEQRMLENVYTGGERLLYLKIPDDVQLDYHDSLNLHFVEPTNS
ncbi:hypothetical protein [Lentibacillus salinarum]|uniref:DUF2140 domain-containing protein n=1 Tax=Lentibacillus salinarum TaxID=446820 RepID=A0ABW3ZYV4_9BACI